MEKKTVFDQALNMPPALPGAFLKVANQNLKTYLSSFLKAGPRREKKRLQNRTSL
jgi:hypothetical protein